MGTVAVAMYWARVHLTAPCVRGTLPDQQSASCKYICEYVLLVPVLTWCGHAACNGPYEPGLQGSNKASRPVRCSLISFQELTLVPSNVCRSVAIWSSVKVATYDNVNITILQSL